MVTGSRIPSLWDPCRGPARRSHRAPLKTAAALCSGSPKQTGKRKKKRRACSFRRSAQRIAAGANRFHATGLITNVFQQAASGTQVSEDPNNTDPSEAPQSHQKGSFSPLAPLLRQVPFTKVCAGLFHTAGGFFCHAAINCNFTHRDKEPLRKQTNGGCGRRTET